MNKFNTISLKHTECFHGIKQQDGGFDEDEVAMELEVDATENALPNFDPNFPFAEDITDKSERSKNIIKILREIKRRGEYKEITYLKRLNKDICSNLDPQFIGQAVKRYKEQMTIFTAKAEQDKDFQYYLGINQRERFPFLMFMVDSYTRDKAKIYHKAGKSLTVADWSQKNRFMKALKKYHPAKYDSLQHAMNSYNTRIMNRFKFHTIYLINDNLRQVAEYMVASALFIKV